MKLTSLKTMKQCFQCQSSSHIHRNFLSCA